MEAAAQSDEDQPTDPIINHYRKRAYGEGQGGSSQGGVVARAYTSPPCTTDGRRRSQTILESSGDESWSDHDVADSTASSTGPLSPTTHDDGLIMDPIGPPIGNVCVTKRPCLAKGNEAALPPCVTGDQLLPNTALLAIVVPVPPTKFIRTR